MQFTCNLSGAYRLQHVKCHMVRRDSSAINFERVENAVSWLLGWLLGSFVRWFYFVD